MSCTAPPGRHHGSLTATVAIPRHSSNYEPQRLDISKMIQRSTPVKSAPVQLQGIEACRALNSAPASVFRNSPFSVEGATAQLPGSPRRHSSNVNAGLFGSSSQVPSRGASTPSPPMGITLPRRLEVAQILPNQMRTVVPGQNLVRQTSQGSYSPPVAALHREISNGGMVAVSSYTPPPLVVAHSVERAVSVSMYAPSARLAQAPVVVALASGSSRFERSASNVLGPASAAGSAGPCSARFELAKPVLQAAEVKLDPLRLQVQEHTGSSSGVARSIAVAQMELLEQEQLGSSIATTSLSQRSPNLGSPSCQKVNMVSPPLRPAHAIPELPIDSKAVSASVVEDASETSPDPLQTTRRLDLETCIPPLADVTMSHDTEYYIKNMDHLRHAKHKQDRCITSLQHQVGSLHEQVTHYKSMYENNLVAMECRGLESLEISNLHQQLSAVQMVKDCLNKENLELHEQLQGVHQKELSRAPTCVICLENLVNLVCLPCRHLSLCSFCGQQGAVNSCPICRCPIEDRMQIFLP